MESHASGKIPRCLNYDHTSSKRLIFGMSGSGKTTLFLQLLQSSPARWKFVFDPEQEASRKLGWQAAKTVEGLCKLFDDGKPVVFWPGEMFESDYAKGFEFFCQFTLNLAKTKDGKKLLAADEIQQFTELHLTGLPPALLAGLNIGRREELDFLIAAQGINDVHSRIRKQATELYVFKVADTDNTALQNLAGLGLSKEELTTLPYPRTDGKVGWIYRNCLTGQKTRVIRKCT